MKPPRARMPSMSSPSTRFGVLLAAFVCLTRRADSVSPHPCAGRLHHDHVHGTAAAFRCAVASHLAKFAPTPAPATSYDMKGRLRPHYKAHFSFKDTDACCIKSCSGHKSGSSLNSCEAGCGLWLHSDLNWRGTRWRYPLRMKCERRCAIMRTRGTTTAPSVSYWSHKKAPTSLPECRAGCKYYHQCVNRLGSGLANP